MHYAVLVPIELEEITPNPEADKMFQDNLERLHSMKEGKRYKDDISLDICIGRIGLMHNEFSRRVNSEIDRVLEPYSEQTEDYEYLEFDDRTEELKEEYESGTTDAIKLANGKIISIHNPNLHYNYIIHDDGKVYQKNFGPLKHDKRSKQAKKMTAICSYPFKKMYKSLEEFAEMEHYIFYNEHFKGYGYIYNPDAFYDWYQIGGRWPRMFLVKEECIEYSNGERSWCNENNVFLAPEGYKWVVAARKKDIEWQVMKEWSIKCARESYAKYKEIFETGEIPEKHFFKIEGNKLLSFRDILYIDGESEETFLKRTGKYSTFKYNQICYGYLDDDGYHEKVEFWQRGITKKKYKRLNRRLEKQWCKQVDSFISSLDDNIVLVGVDCHI